MDQNERMKLQKTYERYEDSQVLAMLQDGPDAFVEGAYCLLEEEARRRGISIDAPVEDQAPEAAPAAAQSEDGQAPQDTFVEIMVINDESDQQSVIREMEASGIAYHFMRMSFTGRPLPLALMVDQSGIDAAVARLQNVSLNQSIVLW